MICLIRKTIAAFAAPEHRLSCGTRIWRDGVAELRQRTEGIRESGAFLLGVHKGTRRRIVRFAYYDDLDPGCLDSGIVIFDGSGYGPLWDLCRSEGLSVVADIHVHPGYARQSESDRKHPMIAKQGHIALIASDFASGDCFPSDLGVYEYKRGYCWNYRSGLEAEDFFYVGFWG